MLDLNQAKNITIIGGGTAGWFAALYLRKMFPTQVQVQLIESPTIGIVGVGEGGLINLITALNHLEIPTGEFIRATGAALKWGFCYQGWRTGKKDDEFYHLFANIEHSLFDLKLNGYFPYVAALLAQNTHLTDVVQNFTAIRNRVSQQQAIQDLKAQPDIATSLHFDSQRVADYLGAIATERGVQHIQAKVEDIIFDEVGSAKQVITDHGIYATDFIIDASGFSRVVIGKKLKSTWNSFSQYLLLDKAIPFHLKHQEQYPELVTRATAMRAGWMWQIPLLERIGAGYVFSSEFCSEQQAIDEVEQYLGSSIEPQRCLSFEPGHFKQVWQGNVMAIGLASGFVEPLEATSIGQMLEQLRMFEQVIKQNGNIISDNSIEQFNLANAASWQGICDFLRMHYDCPRRDTAFWQKVAQTPYPQSYAKLKEIFQQRCPRMIDIQGYAQYQWAGIFHIINWVMVAQPLGLLSSAACLKELNSLPIEVKKLVVDYINSVNNRKSVASLN